MIENTYLVWDVTADGALVRVVAWSEEQALNKAASLLPDRSNYRVSQVGEYWLPGVNLEGLSRAFERSFGRTQESNP